MTTFPGTALVRYLPTFKEIYLEQTKEFTERLHNLTLKQKAYEELCACLAPFRSDERLVFGVQLEYGNINIAYGANETEALSTIFTTTITPIGQALKKANLHHDGIPARGTSCFSPVVIYYFHFKEFRIIINVLLLNSKLSDVTAMVTPTTVDTTYVKYTFLNE